MKKFYQKPFLFRSILLALGLISFALDLVVLQAKLLSPFTTTTLWGLIQNSGASTAARDYALSLVVALFVGLLPLGFSVVSLIRKKNAGFYVSIIYFVLYQVTLLIFQFWTHFLSGTSVALAVIVLIFALVALGFLLGERNFREVEKAPESESLAALPNQKAVVTGMLVLDILGILALILAMFSVPLYVISSTGGSSKSCVLGSVLFAKDAAADDMAYFLVALIFSWVVLFYFISFVSVFLSAPKRFVRSSKNLMILLVAFSTTFFLLGFVLQFVYALKSYTAASLAYIPLLIEGIVALVFSILKGRFDLAVGSEEEVVQIQKEKKSPQHYEPLIFVILMTAVTIASLFLNFVDVKITSSSGTFVQEIKMTGIKLLSDSGKLGAGYQVLAFIIMLMIICSGLGLIVSLAAYFSHYKRFATIAKVAAYVNIFFIFAFGISGLYFTIATKITADSTEALIVNYCPGYTKDAYNYNMRTDTFYALIVDVVILIGMMVRKALDGSPAVLAVEPLSSSETAPEVPSPEKKEEPKPESGEEGGFAGDFDPCPAFSELDEKQASFQADLVERKKLLTSEASLSDLVKFVVDYARNSTRHLSYSPQDIATFVAGLGAARLTILQGMSGTGKTSLPKIFMEAIDGDCDIIEVESSWKDKNELLGYYNEFSSLYTPKKFTQALYKAALNPEIPTFIVLDEMNLSRIEYYFSDFLSLMENEEGHREIKLLNIKLARHEGGKTVDYAALEEGHTLKVPSNVWFVGTANRDESTFVISDKVYDRAHTMNFNKRAPKVRDFKDPLSPRFYTYASLNDLFTKAKANGSFDAENNDLIRKTETLLAPYNISFGNRILVQIEDFVNIYKECFPGWDVESQAVEEILLSKVVSKLEVKTIDDKDELVKEFEALNLMKCAQFIAKLNED